MTETIAAASHSQPPTNPQQPPSVAELFLGFAKCSISGFGGVLPFARRMVVEERRWMTPQEFNEAFALAHFLPGPNIVNFSVVFGSRLRGRTGAVVAFLGLMGPPVLVVILLGVLYSIYGELEALRRILAGVASAAAGLIIAMVVKMAEPVLRHRFRLGPLLMVATFVAIGLLRWPLPMVLAVMAPVSIGLAFWWARR